MTLIILMYALFASSFSMGKILLRYVDPIFLCGIRMFAGGLILLAYQYLAPHEHFKFRKKHLWLYAQIAFFGIYVAYILRFWALRDLTSSKTCFLYNFMPFMSSLYSYMFFNEKMTRKQWMGLLIGFMGFIPMLITTSGPEEKLGEFFWISWQEIAILISVASTSYSWILMRKLVRKKNYSPMMVNGLTMAGGGFFALITSFFFEGTVHISDMATFTGWLALVILISNIICYNIYGFLLKKYTATFVSFAGFITPLFAALYGWVFLGEVITWHFYLSTVIVFAGLVLFYQDELRLQKIKGIT